MLRAVVNGIYLIRHRFLAGQFVVWLAPVGCIPYQQAPTATTYESWDSNLAIRDIVARSSTSKRASELYGAGYAGMCNDSRYEPIHRTRSSPASLKIRFIVSVTYSG